jgi:hypothetical protein
MTLEELFECSAEKLMAMTDEELNAYFAPYFNVTRPEMARRKPSTVIPAVDPEMQKKIAAAAALGVDIAALRKKLGKK